MREAFHMCDREALGCFLKRNDRVLGLTADASAISDTSDLSGLIQPTSSLHACICLHRFDPISV